MISILKNGSMELFQIATNGDYTLLKVVNSKWDKYIVAYKMEINNSECSWLQGTYFENTNINDYDIFRNAVDYMDRKVNK